MATTPPASALAHEILAIGDSVMLGAEQSLEHDIPGIFVDAKVSRQFWDATVVLQAVQEPKAAPADRRHAHGHQRRVQRRAVRPDDGRASGTDRCSSSNAHEPRPWETEVNVRLAADVRKYPNAHLIDWHDYSARTPTGSSSDGIHLTGAGAERLRRSSSGKHLAARQR